MGGPGFLGKFCSVSLLNGEGMANSKNPVEFLLAATDAAMRNRIREALVKAGYAVVEAKNGEDALEKFLAKRADAVMLDACLSGMNGLEVCRSIRQLPDGEHVPILMLTECGEDDLILRAFEAGATDFISKPFTTTVLSHRARYLFRTAQVARDLRQRQDRSNRALQIAGLGYYEWDVSQDLWFFSEESRRLFGFEDFGDNGPTSILQFVHPAEREAVEKALSQALTGELEFNVEHRILRPNGQDCQVHNQAQVFRDGKGQPFRITGTVHDVTDRLQTQAKLREDEARLSYLAYHDALTGLPNRLLFQDRFQHATAKARRSGRKVAVLFLDLDQFKRINDSLGHDIGDQFLQKVAERIRCAAREEDTLARFGGDEFVLLLDDVTQVNTVGIVANKILSSLSQPFEVGGFQLYAAASIGIGLYPDNGESMEELLRCADIAMYRAKELGRNTLQFYTLEINTRAQETLLLERGLRQALAREELEIYYQPQFDLVSGRLVGVEALLRWNHPERGLLLPAEFLPLAEETGLIFPISDWALQTICRQNKAWQARGFSPFVVAVNIASRMFQQRELAQMVDRALKASGLEARFLELEVTENMILSKVATAAQTLEELSQLGVNLTIDDFGTGYSSISGLRRMPIKKLKIDRIFVNDLTSNANDASIATAVIALAQSLSLGVIGEGVETEEQLRFLKAKGCSQGQGFHFSQPLPEAQLTSLLAQSCSK